MQRSASPLLPILRSPFQGELLAWLYLHPEDEISVEELARRFGVSHATVSREADRLEGGGFLRSRRRGRLRLLRANTESRIAPALTQLLALTYGPIAVLGDRLPGIDGVEEVYIFGSWAARYSGEQGDPPGDVDVLIIGSADEDDLYDAADEAERVLGREVNVRQVSRSRWRFDNDDPFLISVRDRPKVRIDAPRGDAADDLEPGPDDA